MGRPVGNRALIAFAVLVLVTVSLATAFTAHADAQAWWSPTAAVVVAVVGAGLMLLVLRSGRSVVSIDAMPGAMLRLDATGRVRAFNARASSVLSGLQTGEVLSERFDGAGRLRFGEVVAAREAADEFETAAEGKLLRITLGPMEGRRAERLVKINDITEYRAMSERVLRSEERFRSLFYEHPDATYSFGRDGRFIEANRQVTVLTGVDQDEILGLHWEQFVVPEDRDRVRRSFEAAMRGEPRTYGCRVWRRDGTQFLAQITNVPIVVGGQVSGIFGIARDVTAEREAQTRLAVSEARFRGLFETTEEGIVLLDGGGAVREANPAAVRMLDEPGAVHHWRLTDWLPRKISHAAVTASGGGETRSFESVAIRTAAGRSLIVDVATGALDGGGAYVLFRDMTHRHHLEEERRLLWACMAQVEDVVMITETEPLDEPGPRIVYINDTIERMAGYSPRELIGKTPRIFQGADTDPAARRRIRTALEDRRPVREILLNYRKDGTSFWNEMEIVPIPATGVSGKEYFAAVQRDVTERQRQEQALRHSQEELRRLNRTLETVREEERRRIARDLHDDLGQALTAIKLDLGRVIDDVAELPPQGRKRLEETVAVTDEAIDRVRDIAADLRPGMLDDLGFEAAGEWFLERCASRYRLRTRWEVGPGVEGRARGTVATTLFRILQECLTNIARHARATKIVVRYDEDADSAWLHVRDNGVGFDADNPNRVGLGLVGMRERATMLGGSIRIESTPGSGTRVTVRLPQEV